MRLWDCCWFAQCLQKPLYWNWNDELCNKKVDLLSVDDMAISIVVFKYVSCFWKWTKLVYGLWWTNAFKVKLLPNCLFSAGNYSDQSKCWRNASTGRQITSVDFSAPQTHDFKEQPWSNYRKARSRSANIFSGGCQVRPSPLGSTCWDFCWHTLALLCLCLCRHSVSVVGIVRHEFMAPGLSTPVTSSQCPAPAGGNILVFELNSFHFGNLFAQSVYLLLSHAKKILILLQNSEPQRSWGNNCGSSWSMRCIKHQSTIDLIAPWLVHLEKIGPGVT